MSRITAAYPERIVCLTEEPTDVLYALGQLLHFLKNFAIMGGFVLLSWGNDYVRGIGEAMVASTAIADR